MLGKNAGKNTPVGLQLAADSDILLLFPLVSEVHTA